MAAPAPLDPAFARLLREQSAFLTVDEAAQKVVCKLTGHSMPLTATAVVQYTGRAPGCLQTVFCFAAAAANINLAKPSPCVETVIFYGAAF